MQYPTSFVYRIAGGATLLALLSFAGTLALSPPAASQFQPGTPVRLISGGAAPFTESWGEMVRRDAARAPASRLTSAIRRIARARWRPRPRTDTSDLAGAAAAGALFAPPGR